MQKLYDGQAVGNSDEEQSNLDLFSLEMFENIAYIMAKHAEPDKVPDSPEEWLDEFNTFSIYQVLPKIIKLWGLNIQSDVESKKKLRKSEREISMHGLLIKKILTDGNATAFISMNKNGAFAYIKNIWQNS